MQRSSSMLAGAVVFPWLVVVVGACGDGGGGGVPSDVVGEQNRLADQANDRIAQLVLGLGTMSAKVKASPTISVSVGREWFEFFDTTFVRDLDDITQITNQLTAREMELAVAAGRGAKPSARPFALSTAVGLAIVAGLAAAVVVVKNKVTQTMDAARRRRDEMLRTATEEMVYVTMTPEIRRDTDDLARETQASVGSGTRSPDLTPITEHCVRVVVRLKDSAGMAVNTDGKTITLMATRRGSTYSAYVMKAPTATFDYVPTGQWDLMAFTDGYVRGTLEGVTLTSCSAPVTVEIEVARMQELIGGGIDAGAAIVDARPQVDARPGIDAGAADAGGTTGDFEIVGYRNTDGSMGSGAAGAQIQLAGSKTFPTIGWTFSGAALLLVSSMTATTYGLVSNQAQTGDLIPFPSPVTYGNYAVANTHPFAAAANPSPALVAGSQYNITMQTVSNQAATLVFRPR